MINDDVKNEERGNHSTNRKSKERGWMKEWNKD